MRADTCPSDAQLSAFNLGDLPERVLDEVARHLESCTACEARAGRLDDQVDAVISLLRLGARGTIASGARRPAEPGQEDEAAAEAAGCDCRPACGNGGPAANGSGESSPAGPGPGPRVPGYELDGILGEGGMGVVYKARQLKLNRIVALKMIAGHSKKISARFRVEAEAVARLQHPNIVQIYEIGEHEGQPYLALEFVPGGSLEQRLGGKPQPPREAAELLCTLARAADHAHRQGIVHRDLKPSNILLTPEGVPRITDFGVAKRLESEDQWSRDGELLGTPRYMAPEQASGQVDRIGPATDVYSLGVILYEMLTGRAPHQAATSYETLNLVIEQEPVPPRRLQPRLSRDLETIVLKCLRKEQARRYADARALAEDLERFLSNRPILARPVGRLERAFKWARRHPTAATLIAVAALGMGASGLAFWRYSVLLHTYNAELRAETDRAEQARIFALEHAHAEALQRRQVETALHYSRVGLAESEWRNNNVAGASLLLDECLPRRGQPDLRGWPWQYLNRICHADLLTLPGHIYWVHRAVYSPDGRRIVAAAGMPNQLTSTTHLKNPGSLNVWDADSGALVAALEGHQGAVWSVAFRPDGAQFATAGADGTVYLWDAARLERVAVRRGKPSSAISVRFAPDGRTLAIASAESLVFWNPASGSDRTVVTGQGHCLMAFSPDGRTVAVRTETARLELRDAETGRSLRTFPPAHGPIRGVDYSPDGRLVATADSNGLVVLWEVDTGRPLHELRGHNGEVTCVAFSPDGRAAASGGADQTVRLWSTRDGAETRVFRGHTFGVRSVVFSPNGDRVASAGQDGAVKVWDVTRDPGGMHYKAEPGREGQWVGSLAFSDDGTRVTVARHDGGLVEWDAALGIPLSATTIDLLNRYYFPRGDSVFSRDGRWLLGTAASDPRRIKLWNVAEGREVLSFDGSPAPVFSLALSPDDRRVAAVGSERRGNSKTRDFLVWDVGTGDVLARWSAGPGTMVVRLAFNPNGSLLASAGGDGSVGIWRVADGRLLRSLAGHRGTVTDVAFSPTGRQLASVAREDPTVRIWDLDSGRQLLTLRGHNHPLTSVAYSPDGRLLASVGFEGAVKLWDAFTGQEILTLRGFSPQRPGDHFFNARVVFSADGSRIASNDWDGRINVWDGGSLSPPPRAAEHELARRRAYAWHLREADPSADRPEEAGFGRAFHLARVTAEEPATNALRIERAHLFMRLGQWNRAAADLAMALSAGPPGNSRLWGEHAAVRLLEGDPAGYRNAAGHLLEQFRGTSDPYRAYLSARACTMAPEALDDPAELVRWAETARTLPNLGTRALHALGGAHYRAGHWDEALKWLEKAENDKSAPPWDGQPVNRLMLALAHQRLGHSAEARKWLALAQAAEPPAADNGTAGPLLFGDILDVLAHAILRREARESIPQPADAAGG